MNLRLFEQHRVREILSLSGAWVFHFPTAGTTLDPLNLAECEVQVLEVPGIWEQLRSRVKYRGQAVAVRRFRTGRRSCGASGI